MGKSKSKVRNWRKNSFHSPTPKPLPFRRTAVSFSFSIPSGIKCKRLITSTEETIFFLNHFSNKLHNPFMLSRKSVDDNHLYEVHNKTVNSVSDLRYTSIYELFTHCSLHALKIIVKKQQLMHDTSLSAMQQTQH